MYSEERLRLIIDTIPTLAWSARTNGAAEFLNRQWLDYTGLSADQAREWGWTVALHPSDLNRLVSYWKSLLTSGEPGEIEARLRCYDGKFRWFLFRASPLLDESGKVVQWYGVNTDIQDRKRAEDALRASEQRFRLVIDNMPALMSTFTAEGKVESVNQRFLDYFGKTLEELKDWASLDAVHPDDLPRAVEALRGSLESGESYNIEQRLRRGDGTYRWFHMRRIPLCDADDQGIRWHTLLTDIDDRKRAEEESFARQKLESIGALATGIAHDVNNLLAGVVAQADIALSEPAAEVNPREELRKIRDLAIRGSEIVRELMIYGRKENAVVRLVDVSRIVMEMVELLNVLVSKHTVLEADLAKDLPAIRATGAQIRRILMNLVTNASDAIGNRDGVIRIITRRVTLGGELATSESLAEGNYLSLEVSDTGCGMSSETQGKVFEPFFTTKSAGCGLGLAVVSGIVRGLGGAIRLTSKLDEGTTFKTLLPISEGTAISDVPSSIEEGCLSQGGLGPGCGG